MGTLHNQITFREYKIVDGERKLLNVDHHYYDLRKYPYHTAELFLHLSKVAPKYRKFKDTLLEFQWDGSIEILGKQEKKGGPWDFGHRNVQVDRLKERIKQSRIR